MTPPRNDSKAIKVIAFSGCAIIFFVYGYASYILELPPALASAFCVSLPSLVLFFFLSKYRDARFIVTLCFLDTVSLIIAYVFINVGILFGDVAGYIAFAALFLLLLAIFFFMRPYFTKYRDLLESVSHGWCMIMIAMLVVYVGLIFLTQYPKPLIQRPEDFPMFITVSIMVCSFLIVYLYILTHKKRLRIMNDQLLEQQKWHNMAYIDSLTELDNRASYIKHINEFEATLDISASVCAMVFDLNEFKAINDTFGHRIGDGTLKAFADLLRSLFPHDKYHIFRIGGDEFAVLSIDASKSEVDEKIKILLNYEETKHLVGCTVAAGCCWVDLAEHNAIDNAFIKADEEMYKNKKDGRKNIGLNV